MSGKNIINKPVIKPVGSQPSVNSSSIGRGNGPSIKGHTVVLTEKKPK